MGGAICCDSKNYQQRVSMRNSSSMIDYDIESIMINNTQLTLVSYDLYKFTKKNKVGCIFNIQDTYLEFTDKVFKSHVGDSVIKQCNKYIKDNEDLSLNKVMHTKGGKANSDYILHGCYMKDSNSDNDAENLKIIVNESLKYADSTLKCSSILFPLSQLKTNCTKTCCSVILACQSFINESSPINLKTIFFIGNEENILKLYRNALNAAQKIKQNEDSQLSNNSFLDNSIIQYESKNTKVHHVKRERVSSKIQQQTTENKQISTQKSQTKISGVQQNEINESNSSQLNKSGTKMPKAKNNNIIKSDDQKVVRKERVKTQNDLEQTDQRNDQINSEKYFVSNVNKNYSYQSGLIKEVMIEKQKMNQKKKLDNYRTTFESEFNLDEEEQKQLKKDLKKKNIERRRNMKTEFLQTNITQTRDDDDTSEKNNSVYKDQNQESFQSEMESDQITSLINNKNQIDQYEDSLLKNRLNSNQESHDPHLMYMSSNMLSHKVISFN